MPKNFPKVKNFWKVGIDKDVNHNFAARATVKVAPTIVHRIYVICRGNLYGCPRTAKL